MDGMDINERYFRNEIWGYYHYVKKLLYTLTLNPTLTDDLAQDTMLLCWRKIETVRRYKNLKFAIATIAKNEYRKYRRKPKIEDLMDLVEPENLSWIMCSTNIEDEIQRECDIHEFLLLFDGMKREYVQVVLLSDYYEIGLKDVAKLLKKNYNTVVSYHARGLEEMRRNKDLLRRLMRNTEACAIAIDRILGDDFPRDFRVSQ